MLVANKCCKLARNFGCFQQSFSLVSEFSSGGDRGVSGGVVAAATVSVVCSCLNISAAFVETC